MVASHSKPLILKTQHVDSVNIVEQIFGSIGGWCYAKDKCELGCLT